MFRFALRLSFFLLSAALLTGLCLPAARADGPVLTARFGIAGHYRPGGWFPVTVTVRNPGADPISGQLQVLTADTPGQNGYGRPVRSSAPSVIYACPVSVSGGSTAPQTFTLYLRGIDPGQANLTLQLVEGRARGDGHVLASINTQNQSTSQAFTGNPVAPNDQLLVGFGGDAGAFQFLNGRSRQSGIKPNPNNRYFNDPNANTPSTLQLAEAAAASDLPDKAAGYAGVSSFLLRSDAPVEGLTEAQIDALKGWVMSGGHLIVCGGTDPTRFQSAFYQDLLPAAVGGGTATLPVPGLGTLGALTLTPKPLPGVRVLLTAASGEPLIVTGPFGAGSVTLSAFDPSAGTVQASGQGTPTPDSLPPTWQTLLSSRRDPASSVLEQTAFREENYGANYYYGGGQQALLSEAVMRGPSLDAPGTWVIGLFLLVYLIVLVPVNYLVLKRYDRKEWAWGTIPALVFVFAAGTFAVGYAAKGGSVFVNRAALIETSAGREEAGVYGEIGLFSPHRSTYDIFLSGANLSAAVPNPGESYGRQSSADTQFSGPVQFVETPSGVSLLNTSVNMWAMRAFDTQSTIDLGGAVDAGLSDKTGQLAGSIVNHTAYALSDCSVTYAGRSVPLGTLASGATVNLPANGAAGVPQTALPNVNGPNNSDAQTSIHDRMHEALAEYFGSLAQLPQTDYSNTPLRVYAPVSSEATLIGWSSDPKLAGPTPQVDGQSVTENDVSLVIVHIPVTGVPGRDQGADVGNSRLERSIIVHIPAAAN